MSEHLFVFQTNYGKIIPPIKRLMLFSPEEWEIFVEEWLDTKKSHYIETDRIGGAGDKGRDVIAYVTDKKQASYIWDCYQCKHYDHVIAPTEIYKEIGKILFYTFNNHYPIPRAYYFVSPRGCGSSLSKLLQNSNDLRDAILSNWNNYCREKITDIIAIELDGKFLDYVRKFDYSIFDKIVPKVIIEEHKKHSNHIATFGGGLPPRPILDLRNIPISIQQNESIYVSQFVLNPIK